MVIEKPGIEPFDASDKNGVKTISSKVPYSQYEKYLNTIVDLKISMSDYINFKMQQPDVKELTKEIEDLKKQVEQYKAKFVKANTTVAKCNVTIKEAAQRLEAANNYIMKEAKENSIFFNASKVPQF